MQAKFDYKKAEKAFYLPKSKPEIIEIPEMNFIQIEGKGNPNEEGGEYAKAMELLYGLSYTIKMSHMNGSEPEGYFEYVVPPLEGLWWMAGDAFDGRGVIDKKKFCWISMIRQPEFVTPEVFAWAQETLKKKKPEIDVCKARLVRFTEGLCAQIMHTGPYDDEPATIEKMEQFITKQGYETAISDVMPDGMIRRHHEIYLGDPRKTAPEKRKTVIRHPVRKSL